MTSTLRSRLFATLLPAVILVASPAPAEPDLAVDVAGPPAVLFDSARDACMPDDMPDLNPRAFRDASGKTVMFALHDANRPLVGPNLAHLKIDCHIALGSPYDPNPSHYADRNFLTATWTTDGRTVSALVHHEYHADHFDRCGAAGDLACWYNTIVAYRSTDEGRDFARLDPFVVAAAPFRQDVGQGRHRGFFNPSNIVSDGTFFYTLISTTGWTGQQDGVCLFRTSDPAKAGSWRAYDGAAFSVRYQDPYVNGTAHQAPCKAIAPFVFPVGSLTYHRASHRWIAVFQSKASGAMPVSGFYYAISRDLIHWGLPQMLFAGQTLYDDLCHAGPAIIAYPAVLDPETSSRNYDQVGDGPELFYTVIEVANCQTKQRLLVHRKLAIRGSSS